MLNKGKDFEKSLCWLHVTQKTIEITTSAPISSSDILLGGVRGVRLCRTFQ
jgi:hypothetical protein